MWAAIGAILQIVVLLLKAYYEKGADAKAAHANKASQISDAVASGDVSRINGVINELRS